MVGRGTSEPNARGDYVRRNYGATVIEPRIPLALAAGSCQPDYDTWYNNIAPGGKYFGDTRYFYDGWYKLEKVPHGWKYTLCKPYRDKKERGSDK